MLLVPVAPVSGSCRPHVLLREKGQRLWLNSRLSRTMPSCRSASRTAWLLRTAPSSGCACPAPTPSVFGALLDRSAGQFRFGPTHAQVPQQSQYVPGTMVLETTWHTLARRARPAGDGPDRRRSPPRALSPRANRPRRHGRAAADRDLHRRPGRGAGGLRAAVQYGTVEGTWNYQDEGYERMTVAPAEGDLRLDVAGNMGSGRWASGPMAAPRWPRVSPRTSRCPGAPAASRAAGRRPPPRSTPRSATGATG
jgi:Domain of unknown function (DUF5911)